MNDLMFSVKIIDAARKPGLRPEFVKDKALALAKAKSQPALIVLDLNYAAADPIGLIAELKSDPGTSRIPLLAFVSHVQTGLRQQAVDAGCDTVVARSVFAEKLPELLATAAQSRRA